MTFEKYLRIFLKRWKLVIACFVLVGLGTYIGSKLMTPVYQSSTLMQVSIRSTNNNQTDYNNLMASEQLTQTEATLAVSDPVLHAVVPHYPGLTVGQLAGEVTAAPEANTQLFSITVVDTNPERAAALANDIAATLIKQQSQTFQQGDAQTQQQIQQSLDQIQVQIGVVTNKIAFLQQASLASGRNQSQIQLLQVQLSGLQQYENQLQAALAQFELARVQSANFLNIAQAAQPNTRPVRPNILLNTSMGLLVGLLLGLLLVLLYDKLDPRIHTPKEITQLTDWPVLATLQCINGSLVNPQGNGANAEAYRILRTKIEFSGVDTSLHSLLVTSALPQEGKSTVAANLAVFMAGMGKNTLLIDANLHNGSQYQLFDLSTKKQGLSNAIVASSMSSGSNSSMSASQRVSFGTSITSSSTAYASVATFSLEPFVHSVDIANLWIMPSGPLPANPSELLASKAMERLLARIADAGFEMMIFDAPPLLELSDASILSAKVDGTLVVIDSMVTKKEQVKQVKAILEQVCTHVVGCVVNKQRRYRSETGHSYYPPQQDEQNGKQEDTKTKVSLV